MHRGKTFLSIIPARGGSKRLPNKNILPLSGKPLVAWTIEAALGSSYIDRSVVTSDSDEILKIGEKYGIGIIKRPKKLALDTSATIDVIKHAIEIIGNEYDFTVLLQPTSPLRTSKHIDEAIEFLEDRKAEAVISVCENEHPPLWSNTLPNDLSMKNFLRKDIINKRSQDLPKYYRLNGAIYICKTSKLLEQNTFLIDDNIYAYVMDRKSSVDIDDRLDFLYVYTIINEEKLLSLVLI